MEHLLRGFEPVGIAAGCADPHAALGVQQTRQLVTMCRHQDWHLRVDKAWTAATHLHTSVTGGLVVTQQRYTTRSPRHTCAYMMLCCAPNKGRRAACTAARHAVSTPTKLLAIVSNTSPQSTPPD